MSPLVQAPAVGAVAAAPKALMVAAITRAAPLPRKAKLALQFSGIAPIQVSQRTTPFCHAEHGRRPMLALPNRRVCHANRSAGGRSDTETSVSLGLVNGRVDVRGDHAGSSEAVTNRAGSAAQDEVSK